MISSQRGSLVTVIVFSVIALITITMIFKMISAQTSAHEIRILNRTRDNLNARMRGVIESLYFYENNLRGVLAPDQNTQLRDCIASPVISTDCQELSLPFQSAFDSEFIIGSEDEPVFYDHYATSCGRASSSQCAFSVFSQCQIGCPESQHACPFIKFIECEFFLKSHSRIALNTKRSLGTKVFNPRMSVRLNSSRDAYHVLLY